MKLLTHWGRDRMTTICISFPNPFFFKWLKKPLQFFPKGAVNYKSKLVQAMAWQGEDTKPLSESVVIQANGAYMSLSDWLGWLLHRIGKIYPCGEKRYCLTHWGQVTHICISKLSIIGSDNGLSPGRRQAIIWTNAGILLIGPLGTNFSENSIEILTFSFTKMRLKVSSAKSRPFCLSLNVLSTRGIPSPP